MTLLFDGSRLLFEERRGCLCSTLSLRLPFDGLLRLNGISLFASKDKLIRIPMRHFKEGNNEMSFQKGRHLYPVEGLVRSGEALRPKGFPCEDTAVALLSRIETLEGLLAETVERLSALESPPSLFT